MKPRRLLLVLGDQLSMANPVLRLADPERDTVLLAEVAEEATYVPHNRHKLVLVFSAMRHFREALTDHGLNVLYYSLADGLSSLSAAVERALAEVDADEVHCCEPGEYRLVAAMEGWKQSLPVPFALHEDTRFLASHDDFARWAEGRKQLRMEYFYREMRQRHGILLDDEGKPEGGRWNFDAENRSGWRNQVAVPERPAAAIDAMTRAVIDEVDAQFSDNPGDLQRFRLAVTREEALAQFDWFCAHALSTFGSYQDGLAEESPWLFHGLISMYLNIGLLEPLEVCQRVEGCWRDGECDLAAAEGFIRQVLGWREYVRGIYWLHMPGYAERNAFAAQTPLPSWFWTARTDMRCLSRALAQSLDDGYAHHIQRLMVIGNFALLAGLDVRAVCEWYLAVYVDAFEWVELPNTLGMALYADDGVMASKPYAASGKYIQRQGNHCAECRYDVKKTTGDDACPYNALYWRFIDRNVDALAANNRMSLVIANWRKRSTGARREIIDCADETLAVVLSDSA